MVVCAKNSSPVIRLHPHPDQARRVAPRLYASLDDAASVEATVWRSWPRRRQSRRRLPRCTIQAIADDSARYTMLHGPGPVARALTMWTTQRRVLLYGNR